MAAPRRRPNLSALRREIEETRGKRWLHRRHQALLCELQEAEAAATTPSEAAAEEEATDASPPPAKRRRRSSAESDSEEEEEEEEEEGPEAAAFDTNGEDFCRTCNVSLRLVPHRALMVCTQCGCFSSYIDSTTSSMAYGDGIEINSMYSYKRLNHFRLQLSQLQATESFEVPQEVIDKVLAELVERGIKSPADVTVRALREVLKKLRLRKQYDHLPQIFSRITGIPPIRLPPEMVERLILMFISIQQPFQKACPKTAPGRTNFLSYRFIIYKFCQLLGIDQMLPFLSLLKGKDKLLRQDKIYREICKELGWVFIPSI